MHTRDQNKHQAISFTEYREANFPVIPLLKRSKRPFMDEWQRFCRVLPTEIEVNEWDEKFTSHNKGLCLGKASRMIAIDIDTDDEEIIAGIPKSPVAKKSGAKGKGETRFFKWNELISNQKKSLRDEYGIEILSDGTQTVIPDSIHPETGLPYVWTTPDRFPSFDPENLPDLDLSFISRLPRKTGSISSSKSVNGRNNKAVDMASGALTKGKTQEETARELVQFDIDSWGSNRLFVNNKDDGFTGSTPEDAYFNALKFTANVFRTLLSKGKIPVSVPQVEFKFVEPKDEPEIEIENFVLKEMPAHGGAIDEIKQACFDYSYLPSHPYSMATAVAMMGIFSCGVYKFKKQNPVLLNISMGASTMGKEAGRKFLSDVINSPEFIRYSLRGDGTLVSASNLVRDLKVNRRQICLMDELSTVFKAAATGDTNKSAAISEINKLYSIGTGYYEGLRAMYKEDAYNGACYSPMLNIYGMIQPSTFIECTSAELFMNGFISRILFWYDDQIKPRSNRNAYNDKSLSKGMDVIRRLFKGTENIIEKQSTIGDIDLDQMKKYGELQPLPKELTISPDDNEYLAEINDSLRLKTSHDDLSLDQVLWNRSGQNIERLAMLSAIGHERRAVLKSDIDWGLQLVSNLIYNVESIVSQAGAKSEYERYVQGILSYLKKKGRVSDTKLANAKRQPRPGMRKHAVDELLSRGLIAHDGNGYRFVKV